MARHAREQTETGMYHGMTHGINHLFQKKEYGILDAANPQQKSQVNRYMMLVVLHAHIQELDN